MTRTAVPMKGATCVASLVSLLNQSPSQKDSHLHQGAKRSGLSFSIVLLIKYNTFTLACFHINGGFGVWKEKLWVTQFASVTMDTAVEDIIAVLDDPVDAC